VVVAGVSEVLPPPVLPPPEAATARQVAVVVPVPPGPVTVNVHVELRPAADPLPWLWLVVYHPLLLDGRESVKFHIPVHRQVMLPVAFVVLVRRLTRVLPTVTGEFVNSACTVGAGVETVAVALKETW
jgi:hypothetical protein